MPERGARPNVHRVQRRVLRALAALSSPLLPDEYLGLVNPLWSTRELRGRVDAINCETEDAATVLIKPGYRWGVTCTSGSTSSTPPIAPHDAGRPRAHVP